MLRSAAVFIVYIFISIAANAINDTTYTDRSKSYIQISDNLSCFVDTTGVRTLESIIQDTSCFKFTLLSYEYWNLFNPNKKYIFWFRTRITNTDTLNYANCYFEDFGFNRPKYWFYRPSENGVWQVDSMGFTVPFGLRTIWHKNPTFIITLKPGQTQTYYLRVYSEAKAYMAFVLRDHVQFLNYTLRENYEKGLFMGFFVFALITSFFFFLALREASYLYYVIFVFFELLLVLQDGFGFMYYWPNTPEFNYIAPNLSRYGMAISLLLFVSYIIDLRTKHPVIHKAIWLLIFIRSLHYGLLVAGVKTSFFYNFFSNDFDSYSAVFLTVLLGYEAYTSRRRYILYLFIGSLFLLIGYHQLNGHGSFPESLWPEFALHNQFITLVTGTWLVGFYFYMTASIHIIFVSVALAERIKNLKSENEKNQAQLIEQLELNKKIQEDINKSLEIKVRERTEEINQQKEEIVAQNEELQKQGAELERQSYKINELYQEVTDSIVTSKFIQDSILPPNEVILKHFSKFSVFYKPKDIVSGDFYWFYATPSCSYLAAVDCTGHGVAGAFMSLIGFNLLNQIVGQHHELNPAEILAKLSQHVVQALHQDKEGAMSKDGMDIGLCMLKRTTKTLVFAGANSPLYYVREGVVHQIKGDKLGIGLQRGGIQAQFTNHEVAWLPDDQFFLFSDGYAGQFGGQAGGQKFLYNHFRELLVQITPLSAKEQEMGLETAFLKWKGNTEQTDDVMVLGLKP